MHFTTRRVMGALALTTIVVACSDETPHSITAAASRPNFATIVGACDGKLAAQISSEQRALFSGAALNEAQNRFKVIKNGCPATTEETLSYVQFTIDQFRLGNVSSASGLVAHWNSMFTYVGLAAPNVPATVLLSDANAGVITQSGGTRDLTVAPGPNGLGAALHVPDNAAPGGSHLYTIQLIASSCLTTTLNQTGTCYLFESYPHVDTFNPKITAVICQAGPLGEHLALAHTRSDGTSEVLPRAVGPQFPLLCPEPVGSLGTGIFGRALAAVVRTFAPRSAFAAHGGLSGLSGSMSPFGGVELTFFRATFTADALNQAPGTPEKGSWTTITADPPGSILVQPSLGDLSAKPVVLNQAGGNCVQCGGLQLTGTAATSPEVNAQTGVYIVRWTSIEEKPSPKQAPFVIRSAAGLEIARLSYQSLSSTEQLAYNGQLLPLGWTQHVSQAFEVVVNLDAKTTSLRIDGVVIAGFQNVPFVNAAALDVGSIAAEFSGIDAGIVGWDNISISKVAPLAP